VADLDGEQVVICISRDITARKKMEEQIRNALREKEVLLREIHHRVKNNMQIISSLLKLQSQNATDSTTMALFRESQNRILSMAMIHEKLYQSEGLHRVNLRDYIEDLVHEVSASFGDVAGRIGLKVAVDDLAATMDMCIPCGLIIIELISNALKYAFPDGHHGEVSVNLHHNGHGDVRLTVSDNGVGIPEGLDLVGLKSLGLRLVSDLVKYQLRGDLEFISDKGTTVHVAFKEAPTPTDTNSPE
jgi:two-component system sensor kinase